MSTTRSPNGKLRIVDNQQPQLQRRKVDNQQAQLKRIKVYNDELRREAEKHGQPAAPTDME